MPPTGNAGPYHQRRESDLFLQAVPGGRPVRLTDRTRLWGLGPAIFDVAFDRTGRFVAFLADKRPAHGRDGAAAAQPRLWVVDLATRAVSPVPLSGTVQGYSWSPAGPRLVAIAQTGRGMRLFLVDAAELAVAPLFRTGLSRIGPWAWWGDGREIVYEDALGPLLLRRSVRTGRVTARWREPEGVNIVSLHPTPGGRQMLAVAPDACYLAYPGRPLRKAFRTGRLAEDSPLWAPDGRSVWLHTYSDVPDDSEGGLPTETDHDMRGWYGRGRGLYRPGRGWGPALLSWTDGVAPPWRYTMLAVTGRGGWLIAAEEAAGGTQYQPSLLGVRLGDGTRRALWKSPAPLLSLDWHQVRSRTATYQP